MQVSRRKALRDVLQDFLRVFTVYDIAFFGGKALQKRALRTMLGASAAIGSVYLGLRGGDEQALAVVRQSILAGVATYGAGYLIANLSDWRVSGNLHTARKSFLDLMSHFKKTRLEADARYLWDQVYVHEAALNRSVPDANFTADRAQLDAALRRLPVDLQARLDADSDTARDQLVTLIQSRHPPLQSHTGGSFEEFLVLFLHALQAPYHQSSQRNTIGFDLSLYEKWLDKDVFTDEDTFAGELIFNHLLGELDDAQSRSRKYVRRFASSLRVPFWHTLTMRKLAVELGKEIKRLNLDTPEDVHAQHFLFPCATADALFEAHAGTEMLQRLRDSRRRLIRRVFSTDPATAHRHVARLFRGDLRDALERRLMVDGEFASGKSLLGGAFTPGFDAVIERLWADFGLDFDSHRLEQRRRRTARHVREFHAAIAHLQWVLPADPARRRALQTAFLTDTRGLRRQLRRVLQDERQRPAAEELWKALQNDSRCQFRMSRLIRLSRQYHAINEIHLNLYRQLVTRLCG